MKCKKCDMVIDDDSRYCEYCGAKVPRKSRAVAITFLVLLLIGVIGGLVYAYQDEIMYFFEETIVFFEDVIENF